MVPGTAAWYLELGLRRRSRGYIDGPERSLEPEAIGCRPARRRVLSEISAAGRRDIARLPHGHRAGCDQLDPEIGPRHVQFGVPCRQRHVREQPASFADSTTPMTLWRGASSSSRAAVSFTGRLATVLEAPGCSTWNRWATGRSFPPKLRRRVASGTPRHSPGSMSERKPRITGISDFNSPVTLYHSNAR